MTIGFLLMLIGGFILVVGAKGTYKFLPPFISTPVGEPGPNSLNDSVAGAEKAAPLSNIVIL